jgi:hypothetical protein
MGKAVDTYLEMKSIQRKFRKFGRQAEIIDRVTKLLGLLNGSQIRQLEQGCLLDSKDIAALAINSGEKVETVRNDLKNFLFWLRINPFYQCRGGESASENDLT